jgi:2,3-bisphosphoglycerate-independent phosphoglycerate mutase
MVTDGSHHRSQITDRDPQNSGKEPKVKRKAKNRKSASVPKGAHVIALLERSQADIVRRQRHRQSRFLFHL